MNITLQECWQRYRNMSPHALSVDDQLHIHEWLTYLWLPGVYSCWMPSSTTKIHIDAKDYDTIMLLNSFIIRDKPYDANRCVLAMLCFDYLSDSDKKNYAPFIKQFIESAIRDNINESLIITGICLADSTHLSRFLNDLFHDEYYPITSRDALFLIDHGCLQRCHGRSNVLPLNMNMFGQYHYFKDKKVKKLDDESILSLLPVWGHILTDDMLEQSPYDGVSEERYSLDQILTLTEHANNYFKDIFVLTLGDQAARAMWQTFDYPSVDISDSQNTELLF